MPTPISPGRERGQRALTLAPVSSTGQAPIQDGRGDMLPSRSASMQGTMPRNRGGSSTCPGQLFTEYFLNEGIRATSEWRDLVASADAFVTFRDGVRERYEALRGSANPNEAVTEQELVRPVLEQLGWANYLPQQGTSLHEDIPDHLLFQGVGLKDATRDPRTPHLRA